MEACVARVCGGLSCPHCLQQLTHKVYVRLLPMSKAKPSPKKASSSATSSSSSSAEVGDLALRDQLEKLDLIGEGHSAKVFRALRKDTGQMVAIKEVPLVLDAGTSPEPILEQLKTLHQSSHEGVVNFLGAYYRFHQFHRKSICPVVHCVDLSSLHCLLFYCLVYPLILF